MGQNLVNIPNIRGMQESDLSWVVQVGINTPEFKTGTEATAQFFGLETLKNWLKDNNGITLVAEVGGRRAGFLLAYYMAGPNDGYINCIAVEQEFRRKGIGKILLEKAISEFEQKGPKGHKCDHIFSVVSETNESMLNLKRKLGFEVGSKFHYVDMMLQK